jgi:hypothetical protein
MKLAITSSNCRGVAAVETCFFLRILKTKDGKTKSKARRGNEGRKLGRSFSVLRMQGQCKNFGVLKFKSDSWNTSLMAK